MSEQERLNTAKNIIESVLRIYDVRFSRNECEELVIRSNVEYEEIEMEIDNV